MVLPQPLSPTMPTRSPGAMSKSILRVACQTPCEVLKRMPRPRTDISGRAAPPPPPCPHAVPALPPPSARRPLLLVDELFLHQHLGADDALARKPDRCSASDRPRTPPRISRLCSPSVGGALRIGNGLSVSRNGIDGCGCWPMNARSTCWMKPRACSCASFNSSIGNRATPEATPAACNALIASSGSRAERPGGNRSFDVAFDGASAGRRLQLDVGGPVGAAKQRRQLRPHRIGGNRHHDPVVIASAGKAAMRHEIRVPVAVFHRFLAVDRMRDDPGRGERHHAFDLREIDELADTGQSSHGSGP